MTSRLKLAAVAAAAATIVVLCGGALALRFAPPDVARVAANYSAKMVCSNVFLAGRDPQAVLADDVQAPGIAALKLMRVSVDQERKLVHAGLLGFIGNGLAVYRPGTGCAVAPDGDVAQASRYQFTSAALPAPSTLVPWPTGTQAQTIDAVQALLMQDALAGPGMRGIAVIHNGQLIAQRYGTGFTVSTPLLGWSMTKTVTAALIGMQVAEGTLSLQQSALPQGGDARAKIKVADLMAMSSGLNFNEAYGDVSDVTRMLYLEPDMAAYTARQPAVHPPCSTWNYSSGTTVLLSRIWQQAAAGGAAAGEAAVGGSAATPDTLAWPQRQLFAPLDM